MDGLRKARSCRFCQPTDESAFVPPNRFVNDSLWTVFDAVSATSYPFNGLVPGTSYQLRIGSICGNDTLWDEVTATTACAPVAIPYTNDFSFLDDNENILCWIYDPATVAVQNHTLSFQPSVTSATVVLPPTMAEVAALELKVSARIAPNDNLMVGVADNDGLNVEWLDTLHMEGQTLTAPVRFVYYLSNYTGDGSRIILSHTGAAIYPLVLTNVTIQPTSTCLAPTSLLAENLDNPAEVRISWNNLGSADTWQLLYDTLGAARPDTATNYITLHRPVCYLPPLQYDRSYTVWVKAVCEDEPEVWVSLDFTTEPFVCRPVSGLEVEPISFDTAVVRWDATATYSYVLRLKPVSSRQWHSFTTEADSLVLSTLAPDMEYELCVLTVCSVGDTSLSTDTVRFTTPRRPCHKPTNLSVDNIASTSATLSWTENGSETQWIIEKNGVQMVTSSNPITLTDLNPSTPYTVRVRALCGEGDSSLWSSSLTFTTAREAPCYTPLSFAGLDATAHSILLVWTTVNGEDTWEIDLMDSIVTTHTNPYPLHNLRPSTTYHARIRAVCAEDYLSDWSSTIAFSTLAGEGVESLEADGMTLFPNPASSTVAINGLNPDDEVGVVDLNGRLHGSWHAGGSSLSLDISTLAPGAYFVRVVGEKHSTVLKLVVR